MKIRQYLWYENPSPTDKVILFTDTGPLKGTIITTIIQLEKPMKGLSIKEKLKNRFKQTYLISLDTGSTVNAQKTGLYKEAR